MFKADRVDRCKNKGKLKLKMPLLAKNCCIGKIQRAVRSSCVFAVSSGRNMCVCHAPIAGDVVDFPFPVLRYPVRFHAAVTIGQSPTWRCQRNVWYPMLQGGWHHPDPARHDWKRRYLRWTRRLRRFRSARSRSPHSF